MYWAALSCSKTQGIKQTTQKKRLNLYEIILNRHSAQFEVRDM